MLDYEIPEGLTRDELMRHPVWQLVTAAAHGDRQLPTQAQLDALKLTAEKRRLVAEACEKAAAVKATGHNADARREARAAAAEIVGGLPDEQRSPDYLRPPEPEPTDPAALAAQVSEGW